jgi:mRNA-degrading endonuclease toxin of MazEF toxin-antitoxin module
LLLARDEAYTVLTWVMAAPLTTTYRDIPTAVSLEPDVDGVPQYSVVSLDNIQAVRKSWLESLIVRLRAEKMQNVEDAIHFALGLSY